MSVADTFGFDTVFAIPVSQINEEIVRRKSSPTTMSYKSQDGLATGSGTFGDWQISRGGDGPNIRFQLPLSDVTATVPVASKQVTVTCDRLTAIIQIKLQYLDHDDPQKGDASLPQKKLVVRSSSDDSSDPVATVMPLDLSQSKTSTSLGFVPPADVLQGVIEEWCNANLADFDHIFAIVDINEQIDHGQFAFCKPRITDYAYINRDSLDDSILGVLCMSASSDDPKPSIQQISEFAIPSGAKSGFLISPKRVLSDLMLPYFEHVWPGCSTADFEFVEDGLALSLIDGRTISIPKIVANNKSYDGTMTRLKVSVEVDMLKFESYTTTPLSAGITAYCDAVHWYYIALNTDKQTLEFSQAQTPTENHGVEESQTLQDAEFWTELALGVAAVAITLLTAGTGSLVAATVLGLGGVAMDAIIKGIEAAGNDDAPSVDMLAYNATDPIQWTDGQVFKLTSAALNGCLQLGGNFDVDKLSL
jgi:hypothetical protein